MLLLRGLLHVLRGLRHLLTNMLLSCYTCLQGLYLRSLLLNLLLKLRLTLLELFLRLLGLRKVLWLGLVLARPACTFLLNLLLRLVIAPLGIA